MMTNGKPGQLVYYVDWGDGKNDYAQIRILEIQHIFGGLNYQAEYIAGNMDVEPGTISTYSQYGLLAEWPFVGSWPAGFIKPKDDRPARQPKKGADRRRGSPEKAALPNEIEDPPIANITVHASGNMTIEDSRQPTKEDIDYGF